VARKPEAIYMHGTDRMSMWDILKFWDSYSPVSVDRLDPSSSVVFFKDAETTKRALVGQGHPVPPADTAANAIINPLDLLADMSYLWHRVVLSSGERRDGTARTAIWYRMATVSDVPPPSSQLHGRREGGENRGGNQPRYRSGGNDGSNSFASRLSRSRNRVYNQRPPLRNLNWDEPSAIDASEQLGRRLAPDENNSRKLARRREDKDGIQIQDRREMDEREERMGGMGDREEEDDGAEWDETCDAEENNDEMEEDGEVIEEGFKLSSGISVNGMKKRARAHRGGKVVRLRKLRQVLGVRSNGVDAHFGRRRKLVVAKVTQDDTFADLEKEDEIYRELDRFGFANEEEADDEIDSLYLAKGGGKMGDDEPVLNPVEEHKPVVIKGNDLRVILEGNAQLKKNQDDYSLLDLLT